MTSWPTAGSPMPVISLIASLTWIDADRGAQHAEHAALGAARDHARRRGLGVEAPVAGRVLGERRREDRGLAVEAVDRAPDVGDPEEVRRVVDHVAGREVVGAVDDQVVALEDLHHVVVVEPLLVEHDVDVGVGLGDRLLGRLRLRLADVGLPVDDLALQVGLVDLVELGDAEGADAGRGQVEQRGAAQAAGADDEHLGVLEPLLPGHPDVGDDQVAAVAAYLVDGELVGGLHERGQLGVGHGCSSGRMCRDSLENAAGRPVCSLHGGRATPYAATRPVIRSAAEPVG